MSDKPSKTADPPVVQTAQLTKRYGDFVALDSLSISLERGQILGFIGPNGAGKTTTIKILVGLSRPTSGSASVCGVDCTRDVGKLKRLIGYMPDTFGSYDNMRVREYLDFFGAAFKIPVKDRQKRIAKVMDITGSTYMQDRFVESLSHGMKQRVSLARTLLHDPQMLILDEPANGLDPQARIEMREILLRLADEGKTLIVTSHILPELARICNIVAIITQGKLRAFGTLDQIMRQVAQRRSFQVQFLSDGALVQAAELLNEQLGDDADINLSQAEAVIRFSTTKKDAAIARVLRTLAEKDLGVAEFAEVQADLEDAFLSVTKDQPAAASSGDVHVNAGSRG